MNALVPVSTTNAEVYRASTDAADLCRQIVVSTAMTIQKRRYVKVEGWQAIAIAHGCTASSREVERIDGGVRAIGEIRRMSDGALIAQAEGFVGEDEAVWFGGEVRSWEWGKERGQKVWSTKVVEKRPDYAIRAMAQTRAISRACRSAFAHVVVMIDAGLSTTPAEEVPLGGFQDDEPRDVTPARQEAPRQTLKERADAFLAEARKCRDTACLRKLGTSALAAQLRTDLESSDPELGEEVSQEIGRLFDKVEAAPASGAADAAEVFA